MENNTNTSENNSDTSKQFTPPSSNEKNTGMAVVAYILFFVPLLTDAKDDPFVIFHVKQGLLVFIAYVATSMLSFILFPIIFIVYLAQIGITILAILGIVNALHGKKEPLPIIGKFADRFTF